MMGKKASVYSESRRSQLFEAYKNAYPELSIYAQKEREEEVKGLRGEVASLRARLDALEDSELAKALGELKALRQQKKK